MAIDLRKQDPITDPSRLASVSRSGLLDTLSEGAFDDLTRMAARIVDAPLAFATVVDEARSFWKSCYGVPDDAPHQNSVEESFCQYVVRSERELIVTDASVDPRTRDNPSVKSMGVRAWLGFPLLAPDGEVLGSFCVVDLVTREWTERDIDVIRTFAAAASREIALRDAVASERLARRNAEALAQTLQSSLLPPSLPEVPGLDIAARFHAAGSGSELVGDFYDVFATGNRLWSFVIGDICGKGVEAAKLAAFARYIVGALAMQNPNPAHVLSWLNTTLITRSPIPGTFLTAIFGTLQVQTDGRCHVRLSRAGHPPPILRRADGSTTVFMPSGTLLGIYDDVTVEHIGFELSPGEALVLYTDGVDEARPGHGAEIFGQEALVELVATAPTGADAASLAKLIERAAISYSGGVTMDDVAVLVISVPSK